MGSSALDSAARSRKLLDRPRLLQVRLRYGCQQPYHMGEGEPWLLLAMFGHTSITLYC